MKSVNIYVKSRKRISTCLSHLFQIVCNLCPGWLICLMRKKGFCSLLTSLILGLYYKLNWPKRASAVYWLLGTLLYPWLWRVKKNEKKFARWDGRAPKAIQMVLTDLTKDQEKTIVNQSYCI